MSRGRDWHGDSYDHLCRSWPSWLTAYEIARKLRGGEPGSGRGAGKITEACEQLRAEGKAEKRELHEEGSPYGRAMTQYRALMNPDLAFREMIRDPEELGLYGEGGKDG